MRPLAVSRRDVKDAGSDCRRLIIRMKLIGDAIWWAIWNSVQHRHRFDIVNDWQLIFIRRLIVNKLSTRNSIHERCTNQINDWSQSNDDIQFFFFRHMRWWCRLEKPPTNNWLCLSFKCHTSKSSKIFNEFIIEKPNSRSPHKLHYQKAIIRNFCSLLFNFTLTAESLSARLLLSLTVSLSLYRRVAWHYLWIF